MIELKEYQKEAINNVENKFNSGINKTAIIWPTGLGKTAVPIELIRRHPDKKFVVIAPNHRILKQTRGYMKDNLNQAKNVVYYTYSGLLKMKEDVMSRLGTDYIVFDEMHRIGAKEWGKGVERLWDMYPEAKTLGLTATPTRMDGRNIVDEYFNGDISHQITLEEAVARGLLQMPKEYVNAIYSLDEEIADIERAIDRVQDKNEKSNLIQKLEEVKRKLNASKGLGRIFKERIINKQGKFIIFCKDIEHMHEMMEKAEEWFKGVNENIEIYSVSTENNSLENSREIRHFNKSDNDSLKLLYSVDMFNEGLHVKNDGIIMARPTDSALVYLQQLGRTLGILVSGQVFDLVNNSRRSKDIYQFYEKVREIQRQENITDVPIDFAIYDEVRDIREVLEEINESIKFDKYSYDEKIAILRKLKGQGMDLSTITTYFKSENEDNVGGWLSQWRKAYRKGKLPEEQVEELTELGINLNSIRKVISHEEKIAILREMQEQGIDLSTVSVLFKSENGDNVGTWINNWRIAYKKGKLPEEQATELTELGINLNPQTKTYEEKLAVLKEMKEQGMDLSTISRAFKSENGDNVGSWISAWKTDCREEKLPEEQATELTELGVNLNPLTKTFEKKLAVLKEMKEQGMDLSTISVLFKSENGDNVGRWINNWRTAYRKGKLPDEQKEALTSLGIRVSLIDRKKDKEIAKKKLDDAVKLYEEYEKLGNDQDKDS